MPEAPSPSCAEIAGNGSCVNTNTSPASADGKCDTPDKPGRPEKKKRRRWAVCAAKMKSGAQRLKALVHSSSDSSDSESDGGIGTNGGGSSGVDSGFGEDCARPFPLKSSGSFSFSDGPSVVVAAAEDGADMPLLAAAESGLPAARKSTSDAVVGAGEGGRDVGPETVVASGGSSGPAKKGRVDSVEIAERKGAEENEEEEEEEEEKEVDGSTVWELSSSSEGSNVSSPMRSRPRLRSRSRSRSGDLNGHHENRHSSYNHGRARSPCSSSPLGPPFASRQASHVHPESPGSYVARMHKILAHVQQTTSTPAPCNGNTCPAQACGEFTGAIDSSARSDHSSSGSSPASSATVASRTTVARVTTAASGGPAPANGCSAGGERLEQNERCESCVAVVADMTPSKETPVGDYARQKKTTLQQQEERQAQGLSHQLKWPETLKEAGPYEEHEEGEEMVYCEAAEGRWDLELMTAAVSAMVGMLMPERYEWVLWLACCAVTLWFPLRKRLGWRFSWCPRLSPKLMRSTPPSYQPSYTLLDDDGAQDDEQPPPPYVEVDCGVDSAGILQAAEPLPCPSANGEGRVPVVREASRKILTQGSHEGGLGMDGNSVARDREEEGEGKTAAKRYGQMVTGLSEKEREFVGSAGEEEKHRLLHQCLEYANFDVPEAIKVCRGFCKFRLTEGWKLVLSAGDLERPLRSRAHTLVAGRDRLGRGMLTFSPGKLDTNKAPPAAYHKMLCYVLQEALKEHEDLQKKGMVLLVDARGVGMGLLRHFTFADYMRGMRMLGGAFPVKIKAIRIMHLNRAIKIALSIAMPLFSAKMRARVEIVSSTRASDGSFTKELAEPSCVPVELGIKGTWTGSNQYWSRWVEERVSVQKRPEQSSSD
ncbi:unnamed protein product [Scytosiphon promiscuus]